MNDKPRQVIPTPEPPASATRNFFRVDLTVPVNIIIHGQKSDENSLQLSGEIMDISSGGLMFTTEADLSVDTEVELNFNLADAFADEQDTARTDGAPDERIVVLARILSAEERLDGVRLYGVKFVERIEGDLESLETFIRKFV